MISIYISNNMFSVTKYVRSSNDILENLDGNGNILFTCYFNVIE